MSPQQKIIKYLQEAQKILSEEFPHGDTYGEFITGSIEIAKMLQSEEINTLKTVIEKRNLSNALDEKKQKLNGILIKLTDALDYTDTPEQLEAFNTAKKDLEDLFDLNYN